MILKELNSIYRSAYILVLFVLGYRVLQGKVGISDVTQPKVQASTEIERTIENDVEEVINKAQVTTIESPEQTTTDTVLTSSTELHEAPQLPSASMKKQTKLALAGLMKRSG